MVFKRRDKRTLWQIAKDFLWPKGGWKRAFHYVRHRVYRLPDTPEKIARGIMAGLFTTFTPLYGLHFFIAAGLAFILRGNILASILGTFFGNPLTYVPIAVISMKTGYFFLGIEDGHRLDKSLVEKFFDAGENLLQNCIAFFTGEYTDWSRLEVFYHEVFFPYLVGGILPGLVLSIVGYYVTLPLIRAYQKRRRGTLAARLASLKKRKHAKDSGSSRH
ncbi:MULTISPECIES: DUF2062 domain-containing protein [Donghicola]|uniref:Putative membrane protein n=1 Tax=Donghicola eburneus TaxID=393278 RepID=A0A1M4N4G0_9RHOB|nr:MULTISPECIES: DUF2062 domain-containing protein [Donghicola]MCI5041120.1 DUF2062 domain-containing protein [Donghicola eburneus]MCT4578058.1 DUF2062 domain-containing protein [Donghicola sp.]SCM69760.1 putative membrane protein [Donghicola eburneus]SFQ64370.1 hypothetical protein SAMN05421764_108109 [Donghicola eburneus]